MDMDDVFGIFLVLFLILSVALTTIFLISGSLDATFVKACAQRGYWQTGQARIICHVEQREEHTNETVTKEK